MLYFDLDLDVSYLDEYYLEGQTRIVTASCLGQSSYESIPLLESRELLDGGDEKGL